MRVNLDIESTIESVTFYRISCVPRIALFAAVMFYKTAMVYASIVGQGALWAKNQAIADSPYRAQPKRL